MPGNLKGQYYRLGQSPTLRSFSKIEAKLRSVELKNENLGNGPKIEAKLINVELKNVGLGNGPKIEVKLILFLSGRIAVCFGQQLGSG